MSFLNTVQQQKIIRIEHILRQQLLLLLLDITEGRMLERNNKKKKMVANAK